MIRWCAYCQSYDGEAAPFDDYALSHGICQKCAATNAFENDDVITRAQAIGAFYETMRIAIEKRDNTALDNLYSAYSALGIQPADLVLGIMQPLLYEVGQLWSQGKITVAYEHYYTAVSQEVLQMIHSSLRDRQFLRQNKNPRIVLMLAPGNRHNLGLQFVELILMLHGIASYVIDRQPNKTEFLDTLSGLSPAYLGVSAALPAQQEKIFPLAQINDELGRKDAISITAGGFAFRHREAGATIPGVRVFGTVRELIGEMA